MEAHSLSEDLPVVDEVMAGRPLGRLLRSWDSSP
jgi:hypothetical protein